MLSVALYLYISITLYLYNSIPLVSYFMWSGACIKLLALAFIYIILYRLISLVSHITIILIYPPPHIFKTLQDIFDKEAWYVDIHIVRVYVVCLDGYYSILMFLYFSSSGALECLDLLLSYSIIKLALHNTQHHTNNNP